MIREQAKRYPFSVIRERMRDKGASTLDFAMGRAIDPVAEPLAEMIDSEPRLALSRTTPAELDAFHEQVVRMMAETYGASITPECVLALPGGRVAIQLLVSVALGPDDGVLVTEPGYPALSRVAEQHHARVYTAALDPRRDFRPDLSELDGVAPIRLAGLNHPNNPTGALIDSDTVAALESRLVADGVLFNDAAYGPLTFDSAPVSLLNLRPAHTPGQAAIELHSLSKLFSLGPLGICFFVGSPALISTLRDYSEFAVAPMSSLQVRLAIRCIEDPAHVELIRSQSKGRIDRLRAVVLALGFKPYATPGGMYVLCQRPESVGGRPTATADEAAALLLQEFGLAVVPWDRGSDGYLRFSSLYSDEHLEALSQLGGGRVLVA